MKKFTLIVAGFGLLSLASCTKDRTCTCTSTDSRGNAETTTRILTKSSAKDAKSVCSNSSYTRVEGSDVDTYKVECKLD